MKRISRAIIIFFIPFFFFGCASVSKEVSERMDLLTTADISSGLPREGLWRENLVLYDMNGDGFLDIVAPPPRKAAAGWDKPFIFMWDAPGKKWIAGKYVSFEKGGYSYGGIAVGDLNGDGYPDLALAQHGRKSGIVLFMNDRGRDFIESPLPVKEEFYSRSLVFSDINGDGFPDVIAASETPFSAEYKAKGILVGINREGKDWDVKLVEDSVGLHGDSIAVGNLRGEGRRDIAFAILSPAKGEQKLIWFGDGKGGFSNFGGDLFTDDVLPVIARTGDVDGDGRDEAAFGLAQMGGGEREKGRVAVMKWTGNGFEDISSGLNLEGYLIAFDLADIDGDGRSELVILTDSGINIYKYDKMGWNKIGQFSVPPTDISKVTDLRAGRNKDGSVIIVYNLGKYETDDPNQGIKAYLIEKSAFQKSKYK